MTVESGLKNGGPAFPVPEFLRGKMRGKRGEEGMSLREWYAGQALASLGMLLAKVHARVIINRDEIASQVFDMADAMLAESRKREAAEG